MQISFNTYNCKSQPFLGRKEVMEKADKFSDELIKLSRSRNFSDENIKKLARSYVPDLIIRKKTAEKGKEKEVAGTFIPDFTYGTTSKRYGIGRKTIFLRPINTTNMPKEEYLKVITHEMTHVFQSEDKDISEISLMNKKLKFIDEYTSQETLLATFSIWAYFEEVLLYNMMDGVSGTTFENRGIFPYNISVNISKMKECIVDIFKTAKEKYPNVDMNFVKDYIKLQLLHEADAYRTGQHTIKKYRKESLKQEDEIIPLLYENIAKCMK